MDSLAESVTRKREELRQLEVQAEHRKAHIAKLQAAEKKEWTPEERDALLGGPPEPPKPRTEAEERAAWDKAEAARSEMQQSAGCGFDAVTLFPELYPEGRPPAPGRTAPEPVDEPVKHRVGIGQVGIGQ